MPDGSHLRDCLVNPVTGRAVKRGTPTFKLIMQQKRGDITLEELTTILRSKSKKSKGAGEIIPADPIERFKYYDKKWREAIDKSTEMEEKYGEESKRYNAAEREVERLAALRRKARADAPIGRRASPAAREEPEEKKEPEAKKEMTEKEFIQKKRLAAMKRAMQAAKERAADRNFEAEKKAKRARMREARKTKRN